MFELSMCWVDQVSCVVSLLTGQEVSFTVSERASGVFRLEWRLGDKMIYRTLRRGQLLNLIDPCSSITRRVAKSLSRAA